MKQKLVFVCIYELRYPHFKGLLYLATPLTVSFSQTACRGQQISKSVHLRGEESNTTFILTSLFLSCDTFLTHFQRVNTS